MPVWRMLNPGAILETQRGVLFLWCPVLFGIGIGIYFALKEEPTSAQWAVIVGLALVSGGIGMWRRSPVSTALCLVLFGVLVAGARAHLKAAPVLGFRYYGPIEGRIVGIDRSRSDALRLTLDHVVLSDVASKKTPEQVRVSLHGQQDWLTPEPGLTIILTGHLSPPGAPVEPGGFDFQRQAWFQQLGAVGYTRSPVLVLRSAEQGHAGLAVFRLRMALSEQIRDVLPGQRGGFAAAILTGDRSGISQDVIEDLRRANLAHLLAISGLHMGLLTGFVFGALRFGLATIPALALRFPIKKIAAIGALGAGAFYLALSGGNVATERAFIMVAVVLGAVLLGRRALTLRAVAVAALIVLFLRPEALLGPGFQMSFAATTALVSVFSALRGAQGKFRPVLWWGLTLVLSSAVAGLATAPIAAAHFNRVPHFGLIANLATVPLMGAVVIPAAVLAALLAPVGLGAIGLHLMSLPIGWILTVAHQVASWPGGVSHVPTPQGSVLPLLVLGLLFAILWQGRWRVAGLAPAILAFVIWGQVSRPDLLISDSGGLIGLMTAEGRALSKPRGEGFAASSWLENDGDFVTQDAAFARDGFSGEKGQFFFSIRELDAVHLTGRGAGDDLNKACETSDIVIYSGISELAQTTCQLFDRSLLNQSGALALYFNDTGVRQVSTRQITGNRLWNSQ